MAANKIRSSEWRKQENISRATVCRRLKKYPQLKCKVESEAGYRIDLNEWEKILKKA